MGVTELDDLVRRWTATLIETASSAISCFAHGFTLGDFYRPSDGSHLPLHERIGVAATKYAL
jgi:hypothetical protein